MAEQHKLAGSKWGDSKWVDSKWVDSEWVDIVDENNAVIARCQRQQMREQNLRHRATYIVVHNGEGKILVQRRTPGKDFQPNMLDAAAGGVVQAGENLRDSARREIQEELGIADIPLAEHGQFYYEDSQCRVWGSLFSCISHGPFALQATEISEVCWLSAQEISERRDEFTADSLQALTFWLSRDSQAELA